MSNYGADASPDSSQLQQVARGLAFLYYPTLKVDQYTYAADDRTFHLVDKATKTSLWLRTDPTQLPTG